jgi:hypothetical protein
MSTKQALPKHEQALKWGGAIIFATVILFAVGVIALAGGYLSSDRLRSDSRDDMALGSSAPTKVQTVADLTIAENALDTTDLDSFDQALNAIDAELSSF